MEYEGQDLKDEFMKAWAKVVEDDRRLGLLKRREREKEQKEQAA
jgi:hypothetical protein